MTSAGKVQTESGRALLALLHELSPGGHYSERVAMVEREARHIPRPSDNGLVSWSCVIRGPGEHADLPPGADGPMRTAVRKAYRELVGREEEVLSSGWGGWLTAEDDL